MSTFLNRAIETLREDFGNPISLRRALAAHPQLHTALDDAKPCIDANSVPRWHELGVHPPSEPRRARGFLLGWRARGSQWESFHVIRPEYAHISVCTDEPDWHCDITDIDGFAASKADLWSYPTIDAMAEARCRNLISETTPQRLAECLTHGEIRIIHGHSDYFVRYLWDGRLWLMNDGGSHHTAAARYLSARLDQPVPLHGRRYTYALASAPITSLRRDFEMFAMTDSDVEGFEAFFEAMRAFRATWLWHPLPRPYTRAKAVLLPKDDARSMRVASELRNAKFADLGAHLTSLCARQH